MNDKLHDFLYQKSKMTDSSECGAIIECLTTALESRDQDNEPHTLADDLEHLDVMLAEFEGWVEALRLDLINYRTKHVRVKKG